MSIETLNPATSTEIIIEASEDIAHSRVTDFLSRIYQEDAPGKLATELSPNGAIILADILLSAYVRDHEKWSPRYASAAAERAEMFKHHLRGGRLEDLPQEEGKLRPLAAQLDIVPNWLLKAMNRPQRPLNLDIMLQRVVQRDRVKARDQYHNWLESRSENRQYLFGSLAVSAAENTVAPQSHTSQSLAQLAMSRPSHVGGTRYYNGSAGERIRSTIADILTTHDTASRSEYAGYAYFSLIHPAETLPEIIDITTRVIMKWEQSWNHRNKQSGISQDEHPSPFVGLPVEAIRKSSFEQRSVQLVLETAAAVAEIKPTYTPQSNNEKNMTNLARFVALYGPAYARDWVQGKIIREYCQAHDFDGEAWLAMIPRSGLIQIALRNHDHTKKVREIVEQLEGPLSVAGIMEATGASKEDVVAVFKPYARYLLARKRSDDPTRKIYDLLDQLTGPLSTKQLATTLGWAPERVNTIFPLGRRVQAIAESPLHPERYFKLAAQRFDESVTPRAIAQTLGWGLPAVHQLFPAATLRAIIVKREKPLAEIQRIATNYRKLTTKNLIPILQEHGFSEKELSAVFTDGVRKRLAKKSGDPLDSARNQVKIVQSIKSEFGMTLYQAAAIASSYRSLPGARKTADRLQQALSTCPPGVSEKMWTWAVVSAPTRDKHHHLSFAQNATTFFEAMNNLRNTISLDQGSLTTGSDLYDYTEAPHTSATTNPEDLVLSSDALDTVRKLATQAGLSQEELEWLLDNAPETKIQAVFMDLVQRLRDAAA